MRYDLQNYMKLTNLDLYRTGLFLQAFGHCVVVSFHLMLLQMTVVTILCSRSAYSVSRVCKEEAIEDQQIPYAFSPHPSGAEGLAAGAVRSCAYLRTVELPQMTHARLQ